MDPNPWGAWDIRPRPFEPEKWVKAVTGQLEGKYTGSGVLWDARYGIRLSYRTNTREVEMGDRAHQAANQENGYAKEVTRQEYVTSRAHEALGHLSLGFADFLEKVT
jgi:hypothetical protein